MIIYKIYSRTPQYKIEFVSIDTYYEQIIIED